MSTGILGIMFGIARTKTRRISIADGLPLDCSPRLPHRRNQHRQCRQHRRPHQCRRSQPRRPSTNTRQTTLTSPLRGNRPLTRPRASQLQPSCIASRFMRGQTAIPRWSWLSKSAIVFACSQPANGFMFILSVARRLRDGCTGSKFRAQRGHIEAHDSRACNPRIGPCAKFKTFAAGRDLTYPLARHPYSYSY